MYVICVALLHRIFNFKSDVVKTQSWKKEQLSHIWKLQIKDAIRSLILLLDGE